MNSLHPVDPTRANTKTYNSPNNERINYKIGPEGQFIPNNWLPVKHENLRKPNANTNALRLYNLNAQPFNVNANNGTSYNYEFGGLARKILRAKPDTNRNTITHWAQQFKAYWNKSGMNSRAVPNARTKRIVEYVLSTPDEDMQLETLKHFVRAIVKPALEGGKRRATRKHRKSRKQTRRRKSA